MSNKTKQVITIILSSVSIVISITTIIYLVIK